MHLQGWFPSLRAAPLTQWIFFPPYIQLASALMQMSAVALWPFPEHLGYPGWISSITRLQGVKDSNHPSLPAVCASSDRMSPLWSVMPIAHTDSSLSQTLKETTGSGIHQKLLRFKILGSTFLFLTPRVFGCRNVGLCHPFCLAYRCLQSLGYWLLHLSPLLRVPLVCLKR